MEKYYLSRDLSKSDGGSVLDKDLITSQKFSDEIKMLFKKAALTVRVMNEVKDGHLTKDCGAALANVKGLLTPNNRELLKSRNDTAGVTFLKVLATIVIAPSYALPAVRRLFNKMWKPKSKVLLETLSAQAGADAVASSATAKHNTKQK